MGYTGTADLTACRRRGAIVVVATSAPLDLSIDSRLRSVLRARSDKHNRDEVKCSHWQQCDGGSSSQLSASLLQVERWG